MDRLDAKQVIVQDRYDERAFGQLVKSCPKLAGALGSREDSYWRGATQDVWADLFKSEPKKLDPCPEHLGVQSELLTQAEKCSEWHELRSRTRLDEFAAAMGTMGVMEHLAVPTELAKAQEAATEAIRSLRTQRARAEALEEAMEGLSGRRREKAAALLKATRGRMKNLHDPSAEAAAKELAKARAAHGEGLRLQIREAARQAAKDIDEAREWAGGFGSGPGAMRKSDLKTSMELAHRMRDSSKLRAIAEKAGRFVRLAVHKQATKTRHGVDEVVDIETGNDIGRLLPAELALLADPDTEDAFYKRYAEGELLQYRMEGKEREGRGPIVLCLDNSGSMNGGREIWAKAFALGLLTIAMRQDREFALMNFSDAGCCSTWGFRKPYDTRTLMEALEEFHNGGTDYETPLARAVEHIGIRRGLQKADIVFVTDGQCRVNSGFLEMYRKDKQALGFSCLAVGIEMEDTSVVEKFSDEVVHLHSLVDDDKAMDLYGRL